MLFPKRLQFTTRWTTLTDTPPLPSCVISSRRLNVVNLYQCGVKFATITSIVPPCGLLVGRDHDVIYWFKTMNFQPTPLLFWLPTFVFLFAGNLQGTYNGLRGFNCVLVLDMMFRSDIYTVWNRLDLPLPSWCYSSCVGMKVSMNTC